MRVILFCLFSLGLVLALLLRTHPTLTPPLHAKAADVSVASNALSQFTKGKSSGYIAIELDSDELNAIATSLSDLQSSTLYQFDINADSLELTFQARLGNLSPALYFNASCLLKNHEGGVKIANCKLGQLPIHGRLASTIITFLLNASLSKESTDAIKATLENASIVNQRFVAVGFLPADLISPSESSFSLYNSELKSLLIGFNASSVANYLSYFQTLSMPDNSLSHWLHAAFQLAQLSPNGLSPEQENRAALWALSMYLGEYNLSEFLRKNTSLEKFQGYSATLGSRRDLALHFLYSAVLYMIGNTELATRVGQMKELSDSLAGGSGYSFPDLAADKAGLTFAEFATRNRKTALTTQCVLTGTPAESSFFPSFSDLPEGIRNSDFVSSYTNQESAKYKTIENLIDNRIAMLAIYRPEFLALCGGQ